MTVRRVLLLLNICLALSLAWLWVDETGQLRPQTWTAPAALVPGATASTYAPAAVAPTNPAQYIAILDRPLFAPDRRPPPIPEAPAAAPPPDVLASLRVVGLFETEGASGLLGRVDGKTRRVSLGDAIEGWTFAEIQGTEAVFRRGTEARRIRLVPVAQARTNPLPKDSAVPVAASPAAPQFFHDVERERQQREEATREITRRQNEIRAKAGLLPIRD